MKKLKFDETLFVVKNNNYSTITFKLIFPYTYDQNHLFDLILIKQIVSNSSFKYKTEQEFKREITKRLIINKRVVSEIYNDNLFLEFTITIPNPKIMKDFDIDSSLEFFYDMIYHPNIENNGFSSEQFDREKEYIKFSINNGLKTISTYSFKRFTNFIDDDGLKNNIYNNLDLLDKTNPQKLYDYYKRLVINNQPICMIYGDVKEDEIKEIYYKHFKKINKPIIVNTNYNNFTNPVQETKYIEEVSKYNQSALYMGYKVSKMKEKDKVYFSLLCDILNGNEIGLIFKKLRTDNNLIYAYDFSSYSKKGLFFIEIYINKINRDRAIQVINSIFDGLNNPDLIKEYIDKISLGLKYHLIGLKDSKYYKFGRFIDLKFALGHSLEYIYKAYCNLNIAEFIEFLTRVKLDTVYFLRGENDEKE